MNNCHVLGLLLHSLTENSLSAETSLSGVEWLPGMELFAKLIQTGDHQPDKRPDFHCHSSPHRDPSASSD